MQPEHINPNDEQTRLLALQAAERRLELCLAGAGLGIWTYNIATDEFWANDCAKQLHGYAPHEVYTFAEAGANIHPEDRDRAQAVITEAIQTCSKLQLEYRVVWRDGSIHWIASQAEFVSSQGEGMFYGSVQDVSERKRVEDERKRYEAVLRESEAKYRSLFNSLDQGYFLVDVIFDAADQPIDILYIEANPAATRMVGQDFTGRRLRDINPNYEAYWYEIFGRVARTGIGERLEQYAELDQKWYDFYIFKVDAENSRRVSVVFKDITAAKHLEEERKRTEEERKHAQDAMQAFFGNVSHEFRTPLTLLLSSIQDTLGDDAHLLSPVQRLQLELAHRNALRLLKLVKTLLDVSRIEAGHIQAMYEPTDLATLTIELVSSFESVIAQAGLQLVIDCPPLPELMYVDRSMWEKIVLNLVSNAFKFTFTGEIAIHLRQVGNQVELTVQDTGIGIAATELPHLFERFYQVKGAKGRNVEGSGIGLSLVQELVKLHGGTIEVSNIEGEGSCFKVLIPTGFAHLPLEQIGSSRMGGLSQDASGQSEDGLQNLPLPSTATETSDYVEEALGWLPEQNSEGQSLNSDSQAQSSNSQAQSSSSQAQSSNIQARNSNVQTQSSNSQAQSSSSQAQSSNIQARNSNSQTQSSNIQARNSTVQPSIFNIQAPGFKTARILLVDDNADMRSYLKRLLSQRWQVETASNGAIALNLIQQNPPDLVLTDLMMPEMDGLQLLQALRANSQTKSIPIILLSARAGEEATIEGLETGADDYLIKPFSARELIARVETHLQLALLRQEQSANRFKTEFLLTVTHELQAPLALILGWVRLLQTRSFDANTTAKALATIERSATIEAKLIKDLLDVSGILSGKVQLKPQLVELVPLLQSVTTQFRAAADAKQIQLIETILNVTQKSIVADGDRLKQIIANLLDNAIKFTPEGGRVEIELSLVTGHSSLVETEELTADDKELTTNYVQITVTDTGIGIPPDFLPYVFDRFTQAEVPSRHSPGGVGIGLTIAHLLVELHKGTIEVASEGEGRGATFTVRLPLVNAELKPNSPTPGR